MSDFLPPLTDEQRRAVEMGVAASHSPGTVVRIEGPAGTGKTRTLRELVQVVGKDIVLIAPTARAALRAQQSAGVRGQTIHSWLYTVKRSLSTGQAQFAPRVEQVRPKSGLIAVEEVSMLTRELWKDLDATAKAMGASVLMIGDGAQLPPVCMPESEPFSVFAPGFFVHDAVRLTQVHRTALDSPILLAATRLREASSWGQGQRIVLRTFPLTEDPPLDEEAANAEREGADAVVIAQRNQTRLELNRSIRAAMGIPPLGPPEEPEPLLIRANCPDIGVYNGELREFQGWTGPMQTVKDIRFGPTKLNGKPCYLAIDAVIGAISRPDWTVLKEVRRRLFRPLVQAELGYTLTCHAAQGGEWDRVTIVVEPSLEALPEQDRIRWFYTALTRAKKQVRCAPPPASRTGRRAA